MSKIEVFIRHCYYSNVNSSTLNRPLWWDKEKVFNNFKKTLNKKNTNYTIVYDKHYGERSETFLKNEKNVYEIDCGKESLSFLKTIDYIKNKNFDDETIIYLLEDDYVHQKGWDKVLLDGFNLPVDYVTLYDHGDKYQEMYKDFRTKILCTEFSHWMPVPSTTQTFSTKFRTLKKDFDLHKKYSTNCEPSQDHVKFIHLNQRGRVLVSSIPGYSTHCHKDFLSPCINWEKNL